MVYYPNPEPDRQQGIAIFHGKDKQLVRWLAPDGRPILHLEA
jgi:hypothetical protein